MAMTDTNSKRRLLIADDEPLLLEASEEIANSLGNIEVITAKNGEEALNKFMSERFDAVLSDITMPKMTGLQFLSDIRNKGYDTPFIILTGYGDKKNMAEALRLGATDFMEKPFDDENLSLILSNALDLGVAINNLLTDMLTLLKNGKISQAEFDNLKQAKIAMTKIRFNSKVRSTG